MDDQTVIGTIVASEAIRVGDVLDIVLNRHTGEVRALLYRPLLDLASMTWTCMVCGDERPDPQISVAYRQLRGLEDSFPAARWNVRHCNDRYDCIEVATREGAWPVAGPDRCDLAAGVHSAPHVGCIFR